MNLLYDISSLLKTNAVNAIFKFKKTAKRHVSDDFKVGMLAKTFKPNFRFLS